MTADQARADMIAAREALDAFTAQQRTSGDPALARLADRALAQHHRNTDRDLARYVALRAAVTAAEARYQRAVARERETQRQRLTVEDVRGATHVQDRHGWHRVVRVSAKSVTVETGYSWTDRIPLDKIHAVRKASA